MIGKNANKTVKSNYISAVIIRVKLFFSDVIQQHYCRAQQAVTGKIKRVERQRVNARPSLKRNAVIRKGPRKTTGGQVFRITAATGNHG